MRSAALLLSVPALLCGREMAIEVVETVEEAPAAKPEGQPHPVPTASAGPVFEMKDGTRVVGTVSQASFQVATAYGSLTIPTADIQRIRFGTSSDPEQAGRIAALVKQLGDGDFAAREKATTDLERMGPVVIRALEAAQKSGDAEVRERAGRLLETLSASEEEPPPEEDEIVTARFTVRGALQCPSFQVSTKYGTLTIEKRHLLSLVLQDFGQTVTVKVPGTKAATRDWVGTRLMLKRGQTVVVKASGAIMMANWGQQSGPEGNLNCGTQINSIPVGALVYKIGSAGQPQRAGEGFTPDRDGELFLSIAMHHNQASQNTGEYKAEISVRSSP